MPVVHSWATILVVHKLEMENKLAMANKLELAMPKAYKPGLVTVLYIPKVKAVVVDFRQVRKMYKLQSLYICLYNH